MEGGGGAGGAAQPFHGGDAARGREEVVGQAGWDGAEVGLGADEQAAGTEGIVGIGDNKQAGAGRADQADAATAAVERVGRAELGEVADGDDGGAGERGDLGEGGEGAANVLVLVGVDLRTQVGDERIEDDEAGLLRRDETVDGAEVVGNARQARTTVIQDVGHEEDAVEVGAGGLEAGANGVGGIVLGDPR